jgi:hypothetical protein
MTPQQIELLKSLGLSNNYEGTIEESDFAGIVKKNIRKNLNFKFRVVNSSGAKKTIVLNPAYFPVIGVTTTYAGSTYTSTPHFHDTTSLKAAGYTCDAVLDDGTILSGVTVTAADATKTIREFLAFCRYNKVIVPEIVINADDKDAFTETMVIEKASPFRRLGDDQKIQLDDYLDTYQQLSTKVVIDMLKDGILFQWDEQTVVSLPINTGRTLDFTIKVGLISNQASDFNSKVSKALFVTGKK